MDTTNNGIVPKQGWSWGAFMLNVSFLIGAKRYKLIWWWILAFIPLVNIVFWIVMLIYLGMNGHKIAAEGNQFSNQSEYDGYVKGLDHAGKIVFFAALTIAVIAILVIIVGFSFFGWHHAGPPMIQY